jgi:hypothetical protein
MFYIFYNIAQRNIKKEIFRIDIELCQHGSYLISVQNLQMLYYKTKRTPLSKTGAFSRNIFLIFPKIILLY